MSRIVHPARLAPLAVEIVGVLVGLVALALWHWLVALGVLGLALIVTAIALDKGGVL